MAYISELMGKPVTDVDGERVGTLKDVLAIVRGKNPHPQVTAIVVKSHGSADVFSFDNALGRAAETVRSGVLSRITERVAQQQPIQETA